MKRQVIFFLCYIILQVKIDTIAARAIDADEIPDPLTEEEIECIKELGLDEEHILEIDAKEITPEDDDQYNRFAECFCRKMKLQYDNGSMDYDALREYAQELTTEALKDRDDEVILMVRQVVNEAVAYCQDNPAEGTSHGQIAVRTQNCIVQKLYEAKGGAIDKIPLTEEEQQCIDDLGLNKEHILLEIDDEDGAPEDDDQYNRFTECYWKKMELQYDNGKIDYDALRRFTQQAATEDLKDGDEEVVLMVKQLVRRAVNYCRDNPAEGNSHGQIAVKTQNCIVQTLSEITKDQKYHYLV
ncbi:hypothetical protein ILUMI_22692 [Ignelater luminosus]|uniref:Uncharacterized protein n=1 Tax=Ignelater luminosus TaxID=2038154 RepID=A0A8K0G2N3_IGNLU|nr:hypothetical protein ILUMI_22692 [Ignelater luminosus]